MEMSIGWSHITLSIWVLIAATAVASLVAAFGGYLLGGRRQESRTGRWLLRVLATGFLMLTSLFTAFLSHAFVYATSPQLRGSPVSICFGDPHWNMLFGALLPPLAGITVFVISLRQPKQQGISEPSVSASSGGG
jgi:hypothetical protein